MFTLNFTVIIESGLSFDGVQCSNNQLDISFYCQNCGSHYFRKVLFFLTSRSVINGHFIIQAFTDIFQMYLKTDERNISEYENICGDGNNCPMCWQRIFKLHHFCGGCNSSWLIIETCKSVEGEKTLYFISHLL